MDSEDQVAGCIGERKVGGDGCVVRWSEDAGGNV